MANPSRRTIIAMAVVAALLLALPVMLWLYGMMLEPEVPALGG